MSAKQVSPFRDCPGKPGAFTLKMLGSNSTPQSWHGGVVACSKISYEYTQGYKHLTPYRQEVTENMKARYKNLHYSGQFMAPSSVMLNKNGIRSEAELHS